MIQEVVLSAGASGYIAMDDDENEVEGRILTTEEFVARLHERGDIFSLDNGKRLITSETFAICCAIFVGFGLTKMDVAEIRSVGIVDEPVTKPNSGIFNRDGVDRPPVIPPPPQVVNVEKRTLHNRVSANRNGSSVRSSGGGDPRARVARLGIFGIQAGVTNGRNISGDITAPGGFADGIDAVISGVNGLRRGSGGGVARMGPSAIGYGDGVNSGFGPYSPGTDIGPSADASALTLKPTSVSERVRQLPPPTGIGLYGGRNKSEILKVVMQNIQSLRYAYNQRLRDKPELRGKVVCRFAIDEFGNVLVCDIVESTVLDNVLEAKIKGMISRWRFEKIDKVGDVTEIVYPFVFSS